jgi:hypothetical protein
MVVTPFMNLEIHTRGAPRDGPPVSQYPPHRQAGPPVDGC